MKLAALGFALACALGLTAAPAKAACDQSNLEGNWIFTLTTQSDNKPYQLICPIRINARGALAFSNCSQMTSTMTPLPSWVGPAGRLKLGRNCTARLVGDTIIMFPIAIYGGGGIGLQSNTVNLWISSRKDALAGTLQYDNMVRYTVSAIKRAAR